MNNVSSVLLTVVAILAMIVLGCRLPSPSPTPTEQSPTRTPIFSTPSPAPPTATAEPIIPNYTNAATGVSLWYPDDWAYEEFVEEVIFASSAQILTGAELQSGAAMMLTRDDLGGSLTLEDLVETRLLELSFDKIETSDLKPRRIGGQNGILVTLEGSPVGGDVLMKGFLAAAEHNGWAYLFLAASMLHEWSEYGPLLEQMLSSVEFQCIEPTYTNPTLGISITYPEGWIFEEEGEQVIFATSEEIITGAELQTGAAMLVMGSELGDGQTFEEMVEMILSELSSERIEASDPKPLRIAGQDGIMFSFEGTPAGNVMVRGFVAAVEHGKWGYLFIGFSVQDEWCEYGSVLEAMLDSVQFTRK